METREIEARLKALEKKGETVWAGLSDRVKMITAVATVAAVLYLLAKLHLL